MKKLAVLSNIGIRGNPEDVIDGVRLLDWVCEAVLVREAVRVEDWETVWVWLAVSVDDGVVLAVCVSEGVSDDVCDGVCEEVIDSEGDGVALCVPETEGDCVELAVADWLGEEVSLLVGLPERVPLKEPDIELDGVPD